MLRTKDFHLIYWSILLRPFPELHPGGVGRYIVDAADERQTFGTIRQQVLNSLDKQNTSPFGPGSRRTPGGRVLRVRNLKRIYSTETTRSNFRRVKSAILERKMQAATLSDTRKARRKKFPRRSYLYKMITAAGAVDPACHSSIRDAVPRTNPVRASRTMHGESVPSCQGPEMMPNLTSRKVVVGCCSVPS